MFLVDSKGLVYKGRKEGMNPYKERLANGGKPMSLAEVMKGADVFAGVSAAGLVTKEMVRSMADGRLSSPWPIRTRKSATLRQQAFEVTCSWPRDVRITPTR